MSKWNFDYGNRLGTIKTFRKDTKIINIACGGQKIWDFVSDDASGISAILNFWQNRAIDYRFLNSYELTIVEK